MTADPLLHEGWVDQVLADELPGLALVSCALPAPPPGADDGVGMRLRAVATRIRGAGAIELRTTLVPSAHRVFFRQVGLDPDVDRTPIETAVAERLMRGGVPSRGRLPDALALAVLETGVGVWACDAERLAGALGLRAARPGELLGTGPGAPALPVGRLVVAAGEIAVAELFGELAAPVVPARGTTRLCLFAVQVPGVPRMQVDEALWICAEALGGSGG